MHISESAKTTAAIVAVLLIPAVIFAYNAYEVAKERNQQISSASTELNTDVTKQATDTNKSDSSQAQDTSQSDQAGKSQTTNSEETQSTEIDPSKNVTIQNQTTDLVIDQIKVLPNTSSDISDQ